MNQSEIKKIVSNALAEDQAKHDITTKIFVQPGHTSSAYIILKEGAVLCGLAVAKSVFQQLHPGLKFQTKFKDGDKIKKNTKIATLKGRTRAILSGERTALNFLGHLSGIATNTHFFVKKIKKYRAKILDTRKTTPGLRSLEKYAVRCGGGINHRSSLAEMIMVKDNHRHIYSSRSTLAEAIRQSKKKSRKKIEVEVTI